MATFSSLPAEILLLIFTDVHENHQLFIDHLLGLGKNPDDVTDRGVIRDLFWHLRARIPFPYALAAVCTRWRAVLRTSAKFWTDVVLYTNGNNVLRHRDVLAYSNTLPIRICITRDERSTKMMDFFEGCAVRHILALCQPHMHRCTTLHIDVACHHSLPPLQSIRGDTSSLTSFGFYTDCFTKAIDVRVDVELDAPVIVSNLKSLTSLTLDGFSFSQAFDHPRLSQWEQWTKEVRVLNINGFIKTPTTDAIVLYDLFEKVNNLQHLRVLALRNLDLLLMDPERRDVTDLFPTAVSDELNVVTLILEGLAPDVTKWIFNNLTMPNIVELEFIRPRWSASPYLFFPDSDMITLKKYSPTLAPFYPILHCWPGRALHIDSGDSGVDDAFLERLTEPTLPEVSDYVLGCHFVQIVEISHCAFVTVQGLKKLVEGRGKHVDYGNPEWRSRIDDRAPALKTLRVTVPPYRTPLAEEDRQWFEDHLFDFSWRVAQPDVN